MLRFFRFLLVFIFAIAAGLLVGFRLNAWVQERHFADAIRPVESTAIETALGRMNITQWGNDGGTPVLMTHGMAAWGGLWEKTALELAGEGYRVIAVDQPPFGFSDRDDRRFSRTMQAQRLRALAQSMQLERFLLIGHSYGGGVAAELAMLEPGRIAGLVLVAPVMNLMERDAIPAKADVPLILKSDTIAQFLVSLTVTNPFLTSTLTRQFMHRKDMLTSEHVEILQKPMQIKGNTGYMVEWLRQFLEGDPYAQSRDRVQLGSLAMPVALIWGEEDNVTPIAQGEELAGVITPVSFERMKNTGHMPQIESPELFSQLLIGALANVLKD